MTRRLAAVTKEENKCSYLTLVKKLEKVEEVIVTEQYGLIPDGKGAKIRGYNCDAEGLPGTSWRGTRTLPLFPGIGSKLSKLRGSQ